MLHYTFNILYIYGSGGGHFSLLTLSLCYSLTWVCFVPLTRNEYIFQSKEHLYSQKKKNLGITCNPKNEPKQSTFKTARGHLSLHKTCRQGTVHCVNHLGLSFIYCNIKTKFKDRTWDSQVFGCLPLFINSHVV